MYLYVYVYVYIDVFSHLFSHLSTLKINRAAAPAPSLPRAWRPRRCQAESIYRYIDIDIDIDRWIDRYTYAYRWIDR